MGCGGTDKRDLRGLGEAVRSWGGSAFTGQGCFLRRTQMRLVGR